MAGQHGGQPCPLLQPRGDQRLHRLFQPGQDIGIAGGAGFLVRLLLAGLDHAAHGEQRVQPGRRGIDLAGQFRLQGQHLIQHRAVDADAGLASAPLHYQRDIHIAALQRLAQLLPGQRLQALEALRRAGADIEAAPIHGFQLPGPAEPVMLALGAGEPGHAG